MKLHTKVFSKIINLEYFGVGNNINFGIESIHAKSLGFCFNLFLFNISLLCFIFLLCKYKLCIFNQKKFQKIRGKKQNRKYLLTPICFRVNLKYRRKKKENNMI
ncbi:hypothetical protein KUTeg_012201 [Tegillarca granosa]|uniref:Uncharacterized protein n=1 Tax=Tegillarca granosa TaxID=220873 RepID=A0ABQ9F190_TEGGR|nr:hypothetical protein KUTeg_012201 [Tegillarca granosa]